MTPALVIDGETLAAEGCLSVEEIVAFLRR